MVNHQFQFVCQPPLALSVSPNKCKILFKTLEQLSIDNLILMNCCIEYMVTRFELFWNKSPHYPITTFPNILKLPRDPKANISNLTQGSLDLRVIIIQRVIDRELKINFI